MITVKRESNPVTWSPRYVVFDDGLEWIKVEYSTIIYCQDHARANGLKLKGFAECLEEYYISDFPSKEEKVKQAVKIISEYFQNYYD